MNRCFFHIHRLILPSSLIYITFPMLTSANKGHNRSVDWLFDKMKYLGHLIDFDIDSANEYLDFQEILDNYDYDEVTKLYDPTYRMELVNEFRLEFIREWNCVGEKVICSWYFSWRLSVRMYWCDVNGVTVKSIAMRYSRFERRGKVIAVYSTIFDPSIHCLQVGKPSFQKFDPISVPITQPRSSNLPIITISFAHLHSNSILLPFI